MSDGRITASEEVAESGEMTKLLVEASVALRSSHNLAETILHDLGEPTPAPAEEAGAVEATLFNTAKDVADQATRLLEQLQAIRKQL